jgi:Na+/glutamate symporter
MLTVAALIGEHAKAGHAVQKLRALGVAPEAIQTITRDASAARAVVASLGSGAAAAVLTGALTGALAGGIGGWAAATNIDPLSNRDAINAAQALAPTIAAVGLALGLALGAIGGWLLGKLAARRQVASYAEGVQAGDTLVVADVEDAQLREAENIFRSYGARAITSGTRRRVGADARPEPSPGA